MKTKVKKKACNCEVHKGELLPLSKFVKNSNYADGRSPICRDAFNKKYNIKPKEDIHRKLDQILRDINEIKEKM